MSYMNCASCGLSVRLRAPYLTLDHCPRCLVRRHVVAEMFVSRHPGGDPEETPPRLDESISQQPFEYPSEVREVGTDADQVRGPEGAGR